MTYDFTTLHPRANSGSSKWAAMQAIRPDLPADVIPLSVADMELLNPPEIAEQLGRYAAGTILGYTRPGDSYYEAVERWMARRHGWQIQRDWIVTSPGVVPALFHMVLAFTQPGDQVILFPPVYYPFYNAVRESGREIVECPLLEKDGRYEIDYDRFSQLAETGKLLIFSSPHNPVGRVWSREELEKLSAICLEKEVLVMSDEIHFDLILGERPHTVYATVSKEAAEHCAVCTAPSKTFNLAGLQTSNIIIPNKELREKYQKVQSQLGLHGCNMLGYQACETAYRQCEGWLEELLTVLRENRELVRTFAAAWLPGVKPVELEGTYLQWLDCRDLGMEPKELERFMQQEALWFTDEGYIFGTGGAGYERINLACPTWVLRKALERLRDALQRRG